MKSVRMYSAPNENFGSCSGRFIVVQKLGVVIGFVVLVLVSPPFHLDGEEDDDEGGQEAAEEEPKTEAVDVEDGGQGDEETFNGGDGEIGNGVVVHGFAGLFGVDNA